MKKRKSVGVDRTNRGRTAAQARVKMKTIPSDQAAPPARSAFPWIEL